MLCSILMLRVLGTGVQSISWEAANKEGWFFFPNVTLQACSKIHNIRARDSYENECWRIYPKNYDKNAPPNSSVKVALIPPVITNLREINVFESTLTLDIYYAGMEWFDSRIQLDNNSNASWNTEISHNITFYIMPHSFEHDIWIPETMLADLKSSKTKGQQRTQSGCMKVLWAILEHLSSTILFIHLMF